MRYGSQRIVMRRNVISGYLSQAYVSLVAVAVLPVYIDKMGAEAYGLVGFFAMLQVIFNLLDFGLTPTVSRETARFSSGCLPPLNYAKILRAFELLFVFIALAGGLLIVILSKQISIAWLDPDSLSSADVQFSVMIMGVIVSLRWLGGLFRGVISGVENLVWLAAFNAGMGTLRFVGVIPVMILYGFDTNVFFFYQLLVAMFEILLLLRKKMSIAPLARDLAEPVGYSLAPLRPVLGFSMTIAVTAMIWVLVTQLDKLILSNLLPLSEYGYYSFAVMAASVVLLISGPVGTALMPRLARLHAEARQVEIDRLYAVMVQVVVLVTGSVALMLAFHADTVVRFWSGSNELAAKVAPILQLYAVGNLLLAISSFPYYMQYAQGRLKLHLIGHLLMLFLLVPSMIWATTGYGVYGAACVWLAFNAIYFLVWVPVVHHYCWRGRHLDWLVVNVIPVLMPVVIFNWLISMFEVDWGSRLLEGAFLLAAGLGSLLVGASGSSVVRDALFKKFRDGGGK